MKEAARIIHSMGPANVLIKGGHLGIQRNGYSVVVDILFDGVHFFEFQRKRLESRNTHGTGCTLAAAISAHLAHSKPGK